MLINANNTILTRLDIITLPVPVHWYYPIANILIPEAYYPENEVRCIRLTHASMPFYILYSNCTLFGLSYQTTSSLLTNHASEATKQRL